jgi:hypothetical protein
MLTFYRIFGLHTILTNIGEIQILLTLHDLIKKAQITLIPHGCLSALANVFA